MEKAVGLLVEPKSIAANYELLKSRVLANSGSYVKTVVRESEPRLGKDGLMSITTEAVVNVKAVQKSLNQMTRDERVELIRASGDPRVSVQIDVRDADRPDAPPLPSPVAENMLKERIKSFGFRIWAEGGGAGAHGGAGPGLRRDRRGPDQEAVGAPRGVRADRHQVRADLVDREVRRSRDRRGDLLQHHAAEGRRQLGERGRSAEGDRDRGSPTNSRAISSCSTPT